ncbi:MAG: dihydropteroate synthase [Wenzhouxiangella sp.]|nr:MAG: dihydropteroate synthase [Wenzhouxiangella sp.]
MADELALRIHLASQKRRPLVMGIVNVTPDSFSDGGRYWRPDDAVAHALELAGQGADILDIGGESTRPGADPVPVDEEIERVVRVIESLAGSLAVPISIDTSKPQVMQAAVAAGAAMINDVNGLRAAGALEAAAGLGVPVCIMHMKGQPRTMQVKPRYEDVVAEVSAFLNDRVKAALQAGIRREHIVVDPGFGFGKALAHNLKLLADQEALLDLGWPLLVGLSRKSMLGAVTGRERTEDRLAASLAAALLSAQRGAAILRVHDVAPTVDALKVLSAVSDQH